MAKVRIRNVKISLCKWFLKSQNMIFPQEIWHSLVQWSTTLNSTITSIFPSLEVGSSGGSRGRRQRAPPYRSKFFHFDIQIFQNIAASGVGTPLYEVGAPPPPPREILDPLLGRLKKKLLTGIYRLLICAESWFVHMHFCFMCSRFGHTFFCTICT